MAIVNEVVTLFKFKGSTAPLKQQTSLTAQAMKGATMYSAAMLAAAGSLAAFTKITLNSVDAQAQLANSTGVSIEKIQSLGFAASVSGSSAQAMEASMSNLSRKIGEASVKGSEDFQRLGVSVRDANGQVKSADQVLKDVSGSFKRLGLSLQEQQGYAEALGIDKSLIQLLGKTDKELTSLEKKARSFGLVTTKQAAEVIKFNDSLTTMKFAGQAAARQMAITFAPVMEDVLEILFEAAEATANAFRAFDKFIGATIGWKPLLIALGAAIAVAFWPFTLAAAAIAGIILVLDDLWVAFEGGESVIASFFDKWLGVDIVQVIKGWLDEFKAFIDEIKLLFSNLGAFIAGEINIKDALKAQTKNVLNLVTPDFLAPLIDKIPLGNNATASSVSNNSVAQDIKINITSTDPLTAGANVNSALSREMTDAQNQIGRGGR